MAAARGDDVALRADRSGTTVDVDGSNDSPDDVHVGTVAAESDDELTVATDPYDVSVDAALQTSGVLHQDGPPTHASADHAAAYDRTADCTTSDDNTVDKTIPEDTIADNNTTADCTTNADCPTPNNNTVDDTISDTTSIEGSSTATNDHTATAN